MSSIMNYISPNDPNGIYKLAKWCAMLGYSSSFLCDV